ncbi:MAG: histidinol-phosphate transaminase [Cyanobacterium sp. T60_A2020_053]|nr:histidinol-phosphate transaminase [Cyanobacterium sp. T60_A2020_053]
MAENSLSFIRQDLLSLSAYHPAPVTDNRNLVRLDANESPFNLPDEIREKLAIFYEQKIATNRYPDGSHLPLKQLMAEYLNESAHLKGEITPDFISLGSGSDELIRSILIATCLNNQGSILVFNPTFSMYGILAQTLGIPVVNINRNEVDFSIDLEKANQAINNPDSLPIKVVFVVHPNSPTANCLTPKEIEWLKSLSKDILVVIDEAYYEFSQQTLLPELLSHSNWLILRTFSKAFRLAAHRVGGAVAHSAIITILEKIRLPYNLPTFSQLATITALENRALILPSIQEVMNEQKRVYDALICNDKIKVWSSDANFIYVRLKGEVETEDYQQILDSFKEDNIFIRYTGGGFRISIGNKHENDRFLSRFNEIFGGGRC